jgi:hypothetical protein
MNQGCTYPRMLLSRTWSVALPTDEASEPLRPNNPLVGAIARPCSTNSHGFGAVHLGLAPTRLTQMWRAVCRP